MRGAAESDACGQVQLTDAMPTRLQARREREAVMCTQMPILTNTDTFEGITSCAA